MVMRDVSTETKIRKLLLMSIAIDWLLNYRISYSNKMVQPSLSRRLSFEIILI